MARLSEVIFVLFGREKKWGNRGSLGISESEIQTFSTKVQVDLVDLMLNSYSV